MKSLPAKNRCQIRPARRLAEMSAIGGLNRNYRNGADPFNFSF
jgi:hypothetical protein